MNRLKKVFAVVLCVVMLVSLASVGALVSAEDVAAPAGVRWFPCPENRQNDDAWEVECAKEGCLCQRFTETVEDTGNANFLDTVYTENGGLTITRNGNDATEGIYWPRIRTISLETAPEFDMKIADTFYFDFTVAEGTTWNVMLSINGLNVKLSKVISDAAGVPGPTNSDQDGAPGTFKGSFNIWTALDEIKTENGTESSVNAMAILQMRKTFVPQLTVFCVGPVGASLTINEMFISTAADTTGANCTFVDMGLLTGLGDEYYEMIEGPAEDGDESVSFPDVPENAWYYDAVTYVAERGYITGFGSGRFGAVNNMQRQDFVLILARIAGADLSRYQGQNGGMSDVLTSAYYAPAIAWAVENGIVTGYQNGKFGVGDAINREQVCTIFYRFKGSPTVTDVSGTLIAYPDRANISAYAKEAVAWAAQNDIMTGMKSGKFSPASYASRAQVATIIMRMDEAIVDVSDLKSALVNHWWENNIQAPCAYRFFRDGTVAEYFVDPSNDQVDTDFVSRTLRYELEGTTLRLIYESGYTTEMQLVYPTDDIDWDLGLVHHFQELPNEQAFFYETNYVPSDRPDNAMYLVPTKRSLN